MGTFLTFMQNRLAHTPLPSQRHKVSTTINISVIEHSISELAKLEHPGAVLGIFEWGVYTEVGYLSEFGGLKSAFALRAWAA